MEHRLSGVAAIHFFLLAILAPAVSAQYVGIDRDGDLECSGADEMTIDPRGAAGRNGTFDLFFSRMPNPLTSVACTFCVHDSSTVLIDSFVYHTPDGWTDIPLIVDPADRSSWIEEANRRAKCYAVQATDFTFTKPWDSPAVIGTAFYTAAKDEPIRLIIDSRWSAYFTVAYATGRFCPVGEESDSCRCPTSAPRRIVWKGNRSIIR